MTAARARSAGNLLTSSNYNDQQKKVVGGRNGYGAAARSTHLSLRAPARLTRKPAPRHLLLTTRSRTLHLRMRRAAPAHRRRCCAGAKLANIFSKEFVVETIDSSESKKYKQACRRRCRARARSRCADPQPPMRALCPGGADVP